MCFYEGQCYCYFSVENAGGDHGLSQETDVQLSVREEGKHLQLPDRARHRVHLRPGHLPDLPGQPHQGRQLLLQPPSHLPGRVEYSHWSRSSRNCALIG